MNRYIKKLAAKIIEITLLESMPTEDKLLEIRHRATEIISNSNSNPDMLPNKQEALCMKLDHVIEQLRWVGLKYKNLGPEGIAETGELKSEWCYLYHEYLTLISKLTVEHDFECISAKEAPKMVWFNKWQKERQQAV